MMTINFAGKRTRTDLAVIEKMSSVAASAQQWTTFG